MENIFEGVLNATLNWIENNTNADYQETDLTSEKQFILNYDDDGIVTSPHIFENFTYMVAPGEPYTEIERMFMCLILEPGLPLLLNYL